jgi:predicted NUDIX family phosphoesterase/deoxycytidine triphosphate deaminase
LRARLNPDPIDLSKKGVCEAEEFFEPILASGDGKMKLDGGEYYLIASKGILQIPPHLNVGLRDHFPGGFRGPLHFAGFVDNGFVGDLVFEVRMDEIASMCLDDGMPVSTLDLFRTGVPDRLYGEKIGSHYHGQVGPRPAKYFKPFDYAFAAREYDKLDRQVLVQDAALLNEIRRSGYGFEFLTPADMGRLHELVKRGFFHSRFDCEDDRCVLQVLPYTMIFGPEGMVFAYVRAKDIRDYGEPKLFGKHSIGVGGHIVASDGPDFIGNNIRRELMEEVDILDGRSEASFFGTIKADDRPVDCVHFAMVHAVYATGAVSPRESSISSGRMVRIEDLMVDPEYPKKYETWSRILIPLLPAFYTMMQNKFKYGDFFRHSDSAAS